MTREACELCEEFAQQLAVWADGRAAPSVRLQDVDADPQLRQRYGLRIPVLLLNGTLVCATHFDAAELNRLIRPRGPGEAGC